MSEEEQELVIKRHPSFAGWKKIGFHREDIEEKQEICRHRGNTTNVFDRLLVDNKFCLVIMFWVNFEILGEKKQKLFGL